LHAPNPISPSGREGFFGLDLPLAINRDENRFADLYRGLRIRNIALFWLVALPEH
jgi:hypothetical protein